MNVTWSDEALAEVDAILIRITERSPQSADRWLDRLLAKLDTLAEFPESGRVILDFKDELLREWLIGSYRVAYLVRPASIEIASVWHGARRPPWRGIRGAIQDDE